MTTQGPWATEDFDALHWHDVHVHGFRFDAYDENEGSADVLLDIDYIMEWHKSDTSFQFTVCPAVLRFHKVFGLEMALNYAQPSAGMCPFSIQSIERKVLELRMDHKSYSWHILFNWPKGEIKFDAPGFTLTLTGMPRKSLNQWLNSGERW